MMTPQELGSQPLKAPRPLRNLKRGQERAVVWRLFVRLTHLMAKRYFPGRSYGDTAQLRSVLVHVLLPTIEGTKAPTVSDLARVLEISRPTVARRLQELISIGYVERVGDRYVATERCDLGGEELQRYVNRLVREVELAAKTLSALMGGYVASMSLWSVMRDADFVWGLLA